MALPNEKDMLEEKPDVPVYSFPQTPFENIGFALSGGGFRAGAYGLGVLSLINHVKWEEDGVETNLLQKVTFVSSASGGTIPLSVYVASIHHQIPFLEFYRHLNKHMTGEALVEKAIAILNDTNTWNESDKSRNIINAFARAYHETLFSIIPEPGRILGGIMTDDAAEKTVVHIDEFCFNATDFYTGISFRFQGAKGWSGAEGGMFGNQNVGINWPKKQEALTALKQIRLSDILAASSCFPMGFEPIIFPKDFTYSGGPSTQALKDSLKLDMLSWDEKNTDEVNLHSRRAKKEKEFAQSKTFGLMDGGICDNQGLYSLLLADERGNIGTQSDLYHRFDLLMVSDVTSFYMSPYNVPEIATGKNWMRKSPADYWKKLKKFNKSISNAVSGALWISIIIAILFSLPLLLEGTSISAIGLALVGLVFLGAAIVMKTKYASFLKSNHVINESLEQSSLEDLVKLHIPKESFTKRTAIKLVSYLQSVQTGVILQMANARLQSSAIMIGDVFLKHIRRLIYDQLFSNPRFVYRRLHNVIYKLTYTNNKNRKLPAFEPREQESRESYEKRKTVFLAEVKESCKLSEKMQKTAECAYSTGTTMWFEMEQEDAIENNRKALIATGHFTTCYNLLAYTLTLKHSRHFSKLNNKYKGRINTVTEQLKTLMQEFEKDPYYLHDLLE